MHISFSAAAALVAGGLQASALPTSDRSSTDLEPVSLTGLGELDETAIDWWPATNCISCIATCLGGYGIQGWWYDDTKTLRLNQVTTFSTCGLTCVSRNACFPAQQGVWNWQTLQQVTTNNEPAQMLAQMGMNGLVVP